MNQFFLSLLRLFWALAFVMIGVLHFVSPGIFAAIVPDYLPFPLALVYISGFFEILGGVGLLVKRVRSKAGWGLMALLIAVFPANVNMALNSIDFGLPHTWLWWRLALQPVIIAFVFWVSRPDRGGEKNAS